MTMTPRGRLAALLCSAALVGVSACSKSSDNSNKGTASSTAPKTAAAVPPSAKEGATPAATAQPAANAAAKGPRAETAEYVVELVPPTDVAAGSEASFKVVVKPKGHWHFNLDFPTSVKAAASEGMTVAKPVQKLDDATAKSEEGGAEWAVAVTPGAAGEGTVTCDVKFAVCTETTCDPKKETIALKVEAK